MRQINKEIVIFSVYREETADNNLINHIETMAFLDRNNLKYTELVGYYKGSSELSILVHLSNPAVLNLVLRVAATFNQESILVSGSDRSSKLIYLNGNSESHIGTLRSVSEHVAKKQHSYTYNPATDEYFTCL